MSIIVYLRWTVLLSQHHISRLHSARPTQCLFVWYNRIANLIETSQRAHTMQYQRRHSECVESPLSVDRSSNYLMNGPLTSVKQRTKGRHSLTRHRYVAAGTSDTRSPSVGHSSPASVIGKWPFLLTSKLVYTRRLSRVLHTMDRQSQLETCMGIMIMCLLRGRAYLK